MHKVKFVSCSSRNVNPEISEVTIITGDGKLQTGEVPTAQLVNWLGTNARLSPAAGAGAEDYEQPQRKTA